MIRLKKKTTAAFLNVLRTLVRVVIPATGVAMLVSIVRASLDPRSYLRYEEHPTDTVAWVGLFVILETAGLFFVLGLDRPGRVWMRGCAVLVVLIPWTFLVSGFVIEAPGFIILHALWLWLLVGVIAACVLVSAALQRFSARADV